MNDDETQTWVAKFSRIWNYLFPLRLLAGLIYVLYLLGKVLYWLFTSSWQDIRATLIFGALVIAVLTVLARIIPLLEHSMWHLITLMIILLIATVILIVPALELWGHA